MNWVHKRKDGRYRVALSRTLFTELDLLRLHKRIEKVIPVRPTGIEHDAIFKIINRKGKSMNSVKVEKITLLKILEKNLQKHKKTVEAVMTEYRRRVINELDKALQLAREGKQLITSIKLIQPMDMSHEYERAIGMLKMHVKDTIDLDADEYENYVMDRWGWSRQFSTTSASYSSSSVSSS